ncbi:MAG: ATP:cob(I)alamin adenosyltransferase, partial [Actinomycetota bacterium]|nr:ATP:cob(I)alamin adenosyltransferase [Actinomycetota bacterium]
MKIYTRKGDDGTTGLLYGGRVDKDDLRTEVYGTLDETVSALGVARAAGLVERVEHIVVRVQREMFVAGAQLAT